MNHFTFYRLHQNLVPMQSLPYDLSSLAALISDTILLEFFAGRDVRRRIECRGQGKQNKLTSFRGV
jgi:hypothetical protein